MPRDACSLNHFLSVTRTAMFSKRFLCRHSVTLSALLGFSAAGGTASIENWSQFRGPNGSGTLADARPPVEIGPTNGVLWNIEVPWSPSSPCIWKDRIFLTTFSAGELQTRGYDRTNGRLLWTRAIKPAQLETFHNTDGSPAASTPVTDGYRVVSYFGSFGVLCHDLAGKELWRLRLPVAVSGGGYGSGTSPIIVKSKIIINRDQDENASLLALNLANGKKLWNTARLDARGSFGTPVVWDNQGEDEIVIAGSGRLKGYDLKTGRERWLVDGVASFACTTPVIGGGMLFFAGWSPGKEDPWPSWEKFLERHDKNHDGEIALDEFSVEERDFVRGLDRNHDGKITREDWDLVQSSSAKAENLLLAVKPGGQGEITKTHVAWKASRGLPYVPSPLFYEGRIYLLKDGGLISSFDSQTGKSFYTQERLDAAGQYYASPVAADGRIYAVSLAGNLTVIKAGGDKPEILHQAKFGERIFATPALAGRHLYLRTHSRLFAFRAESAAKP